MDEQLETWKIALDLALRDYEHTVNTWPGTLRDKGMALIQLYTVSAGTIPFYLAAVFVMDARWRLSCLSFRFSSFSWPAFLFGAFCCSVHGTHSIRRS